MAIAWRFPQNGTRQSRDGTFQHRAKILQVQGRGQQGYVISRWAIFGPSTAYDRTGTLSRTLDSTTSSGSADVLVKGSTTRTLTGLSRSVTAVVQVKAQVTNAVLEGIGRSSTGSVFVKGSTTRTLDPLVSSGALDLLVKGFSTKTLGDVTIVSAGTVSGALTEPGQLLLQAYRASELILDGFVAHSLLGTQVVTTDIFLDGFVTSSVVVSSGRVDHITIEGTRI